MVSNLGVLHELLHWFRVVTVQEARSHGATHEGYFYGLPVWVKNPDGESCVVVSKWNPADFLVEVICCLAVVVDFITGQPPCAWQLVVRPIARGRA